MLPSFKLTYKFLGAVVFYAAFFGLIIPALLSIANDFMVIIGLSMFLGLICSIPFVAKNFIVKYLDEQKALNNTTTPKENN